MSETQSQITRLCLRRPFPLETRHWIPIALAFAALDCTSLAVGETIGIPWTGSPGVSETVGEIMSRSKQALPGAGGPAEMKKRALRNFSSRSQSPYSPVAGNEAPVTTSTPQTSGTSFLGARLSDSGFIPPDSMGDVGPTQVLVFVNGRIRVFDRNGVMGALNTTPENFFSSVTGNGITDPRVRYDRLTGRWFVLAIDIPNSKKNNNVVIAVSSGPTITDTTSFTFHSFKPSALPPANNGTFADYPTLGVDANALYIGANIFSSAFYEGTEGYVVNKASLISGTPTITAFRNFATGTGNGMFTPQGVDNDASSASFGYFIGVDNVSQGLLVLRRITNPGGVPSISSDINLPVPATVDPMGGVVAKDVATPLDDLDNRLFAARMHNGRLWTAHNIEVDASGNASTSGNRNGARWYEITNLDAGPTLNQSGTLFDPAATNPNSYFIPSCAMSGQGHMALACSTAGVNSYAQIAAAGRFANDPLGTIGAPAIIQTSSTSYNVGSQTPRRWGDYSIVSVDPNDNMTMWTVQEYCDATNSWAVRVIQLKAPPPATPNAVLPGSVNRGTTTNVTVTGLSNNGSGFFDPDPSFPNHIQASVNGGGVTVNSITYTNPTQITLNLTVSAGAALGGRTITVTNPDGQFATSTTGILDIAAGGNTPPVINAASITPASPVTTDDLVAAVTSYTDADGNPVTFSYQWQHGTTDIPYTTNTLSASVTLKGENYRCVITPNDGTVNGTAFTTGSVIVLNSPPVITAATSTPATPLATDDLTASVTSFSDSDGDMVSFSYQWQQGTTDIPYTANTLPASATAKGLSYRCVITPNDGTANGAPFPTDSVTVLNSPPIITAASITPASPDTTINLVADVTSFIDGDGDMVSYSYQWQEGTTDIPQTSNTLPASASVAGKSYRCIITPNDGQVNGTPFPTAAMLVPEDSDGNGINDDWEVANFGSIGINPDADNDGDGLKNRNEYYFGLDPDNGASLNPITAQLDKTAGTFSYQRRSPLTGISFTVWTSTDLETWTRDSGAIQNPGAAIDQVETVTVTLSADKPLTDPRYFVRVKAE